MKWEIKPCWIIQYETTIDTHSCELIPDMFTIVLYVHKQRGYKDYWLYQCAALGIEGHAIGPTDETTEERAKELAYREVKTIVTDLYNALK